MAYSIRDSYWIAPVAVFAYLLLKLLRVGRRDKRLPPGPPTLPVIGNLHQVPRTALYKKLKEWGDKYGEIFSLKLGSGTLIVLNDRKAIHELMDKRGLIYSDRPHDHIASLVLNGETFAFMNASDPAWRAQRKLVAQWIAPRMLDEKVAPIQDAEIVQLMKDLLETPDNFYNHIKRTTASISSVMIFGHRGPTYEDFWANSIYQVMDLFTKAMEVGANPPVDQFPILRSIPDSLAPWNRRAKNVYSFATKIWGQAREKVDHRRSLGDIRTSVIDSILNGSMKMDWTYNDRQLNNFLGSIHEGASDTTASAITSAIMLLAKHPEVQRQAQEELDRVCGDQRMPAWSDFESLPYINCIVKEGLRCLPPGPVGIPHRVTRDDWYNGMLIPKDAMIMLSVWPLHHTAYEDADRYYPDRFRNHPKTAVDYIKSPDYNNRDKFIRGNRTKYIHDGRRLTLIGISPHHYAYGAGRRSCVGIHLAERTQWRVIAQLLWAFTIEPSVDPVTKRPVELNEEDTIEGIVHFLAPYKVDFKPRSKERVEVIQKTFAGYRDYMRSWE